MLTLRRFRLPLLLPALLVASLLVAALAAASRADSLSPPQVTGLSPNDGPPAGGTSVAISGTNFTAATAVKFVSEFGAERDAISITVNSDTSITAVSPSNQGIADVRVLTPEGTSAKNPQDRFGYGPIVAEMTPWQGPAVGGTSVTLSGFGLEGATAVHFGANLAASFAEDPDGSITAVSPPVTAGSTVVAVTVTAPEGPSTTYSNPDAEPANFFAYGPTVTSVEPDEGSAAGGTAVTIHGSGFKSPVFRGLIGPFAEAVYFGSTKLGCGSPYPNWLVPCAPVNFEVESDTEITALSPPGVGTVDVQVETEGGPSPAGSVDRFSYFPPEPNSEPAAPEGNDYDTCVARARAVFRSARRVAKSKHGRAHAMALKLAYRRKHKAISACRGRPDKRHSKVGHKGKHKLRASAPAPLRNARGGGGIVSAARGFNH
jgi:IPT/TIG domain